jgi:hypothetical protein
MPDEKKPDNPYSALRQQALDAAPSMVDADWFPGEPFGILMETGYQKAIVTLVSLADGTTSLYFSNGGGVIGAGRYESISGASKRFVGAARAYVNEFEHTSVYPSPEIGEVRFYVLTNLGVLTYRADESDLGNNLNPLSPLFDNGQDVITALRIAKVI